MSLSHEDLLTVLTMVESRDGMQRFVAMMASALGRGVACLWRDPQEQSVAGEVGPGHEEELEKLRRDEGIWPLLGDARVLSAPGLTLLAARQGEAAIGALALITGDDDGPPVDLDRRWHVALCSAFRRIHKQRAQEESAQRFISLTQGANIGYLVATRNGTITEVNDRLVELLGSPSPQATMNINLRTFPPLVKVGVAQCYAACVDEERDTADTIPYTSAWGKEVLLHFRFRPLRNAQGRVTGAHGMVDDLTPLAQLRADKARAEEALFQRQKLAALGTLAGGVAHDLNNVMAGIMSFAEGLREEHLLPALRADAEQIIASVLRGRALTEDLLAFTHPSPRPVAPVHFHDVVHQVGNIIQRSAPSGVSLHLSLLATSDLVMGDPRRLELMVMNLLLNAVRAIRDDGDIRIITSELLLPAPLWPELASGRYLRCVVQDNGVGMCEEVLQRAMEPFFTTRPSGEGTGLGLALVHSTLLAQGGGLRIESQEGRGTTVTLALPLAEGRAHAQTEPARAAPPPLAGTALLIDDDPVVLRAHERALKRLGLTVVPAQSCREALALCERLTPTVVVSDLNMPEISGLECVVRDGFPKVPVLLVSGLHGAPLDGLSWTPGVRFLPKPFTQAELKEALDALLEHAPRED
ncbi:MAG: response regulator [Deltaproteobacteria bacterium]|nr:response regulator [Deltaproteobacteria bacterium]